MKKIFLPAFILLAICFTINEFTGIAPVSAETASEPAEVINPDGTVETGSEWSGDITEPAGTAIGEPAIPVEAPTPSTPVEVEVTDVVITTTPATHPAAVNTAPISTPVAQPEPAVSTEPTVVDAANSNESSTDTTGTDTASTDTADSTYIEVPETSFSEKNRKITLMALISTALIFFSSIFIASAYSLFRLIRSERKQKEHESAVEATIRRHITRAE